MRVRVCACVCVCVEVYAVRACERTCLCVREYLFVLADLESQYPSPSEEENKGQKPVYVYYVCASNSELSIQCVFRMLIRAKHHRSLFLKSQASKVCQVFQSKQWPQSKLEQ